MRNAARDVQELRKIRTAQDLERERLEAEVETRSFQLDEARSELLKTKQDVTDFDRRYRDVATALTVAQARRQSSAPAENPDIQPLPPVQQPVLQTPPPVAAEPELAQHAAVDAPSEKKSYDMESLTDDDISDRIMDFRLGLRSDIT